MWHSPWLRLSARNLFRSARWLSILPAISLALAAQPSVAQLPQSQRDSLAAKIDQAREDLDPARIPRMEQAAASLEQAYARLVEHLNATADPANRDAWLAYLGYDELAEAIASDVASVAEQGRLAQSLYWRLARNQAGLERQPLVDFREAISRFISAALFDDTERTVRTVTSQLGQISKLLREEEGVLTSEDTARINRVLQFAVASGLAPQLVDQIRSAIGRKNVRVLVGQDLVTDLINRPVVRDTPSNECILGVRIIGQAHLEGAVMADLLPSEGAARLRLTMAAQFSNLGTGYAPPVRLRTYGFGNVSASRVLLIGDAGVAAEPVVASAALDSKILGIEHHLRIVRKIAARRAAEQKAEANRVAAAKLETRVAREFAEETDQQLAGADLLPSGDVDAIFRRLDLSKPSRDWSSSSEYLRLGLVVRDNDQTTTAVAPPAVPLGHDLVVQIQESAIDNSASQLLRDRALTELELKSFFADLLPNLRGSDGVATAQPIAAAAKVAQGAAVDLGIVDPVKIYFAPLRPVIFEARDGKLRIGIRGTRFEQQAQVLDQAMEITAIYHPTKTNEGHVILEREGEVQVEFPGGRERRLSITEIALRGAVVQKLAEAFPAQLLDQPIVLDRNQASNGSAAGMARPAAPTLRAEQIFADQGWLTVVLETVQTAPPASQLLVLE